jgi:hypothetical protein
MSIRPVNSGSRRLGGLAVVGAALVAIAWTWRAKTNEPECALAPPAAAAGSRVRSGAPADLSIIDRDASLVATLRTQEVDSIADALRALLSSEPDRMWRLVARIARTPDERYQLLSRLLPEWVAIDPRAAWIWSVRHTDAWSQSGQPAPTEIVLARLAANSPAVIAPLLFADGGPAPALVDQALAVLLRAHRLDEAQGLLGQWAAPASEATASFERVAFALAENAPSRAAAWLQTLPSSPGRDAGLGVVAGAWAARNGPEAMAWAETLPKGDARELALQRAFGCWVERESEPALRWLAAHEAEPEADGLIARWIAVSEQIRRDPGLARPWIALIREPALRAQAIDALQQ